MNAPASPIAPAPRFPKPLALPLGLVPVHTHSALLVRLLNRLFAPELADGELDFLQDRVMLVEVDDARIRFKLTLRDGRLAAAHSRHPHDLSIGGQAYGRSHNRRYS